VMKAKTHIFNRIAETGRGVRHIPGPIGACLCSHDLTKFGGYHVATSEETERFPLCKKCTDHRMTTKSKPTPAAICQTCMNAGDYCECALFDTGRAS